MATPLRTGGLEQYAGSGLGALVITFAIVGAALGTLLLVTATVAARWPRVRVLWYPLHLTILLLQMLDGASTWVGVEDPFGLRLPPYREQVALSAFILEQWGGFVFFVLKTLVGIGIVYGLDLAVRAAQDKRERAVATVAYAGIVVVGAVPVLNNIGNFLAVL